MIMQFIRKFMTGSVSRTETVGVVAGWLLMSAVLVWAYDSTYTGAQVDQAVGIANTLGGVTGIVKVDGANTPSAAVEDTDYQGVLAEGAFADGDKTKLDGIEALADVTDATNVAAAGALMDSGTDNVDDTHINWGTGAGQVSAVDVPIADAGGIITATEVEAALQENRTAIDLNTAKTIDDTAYNATSWDGNTDAPTKNAVRDKIETMGASGEATTYEVLASNGDVDTDLSDGATASTVPSSAAAKDYADSVAGAPTNVTPVDTADENASFYVILVDGATGSQATETDVGLRYNPSTNILSATGFSSTAAAGSQYVSADNDATALSTDTDDVAGRIAWSDIDSLWHLSDGTDWNDYLVTNNSVAGNTETGITVTAQTDGTLDFVVSVSSSEIAAATLVTDAEGIANNDNNTTFPTCAAVKDYADAAGTRIIPPIIVKDPDASSDYPIFRAPAAITITAVRYLCVGGTSWTGQIQEADANGTTGVDTQTTDTTASAGTTTSVTSFSNASIDSGDWLLLNSTSISGTPTSISVQIEYTID